MSEGLKAMKALSFSAEIEFNAWAYEDNKNDEGLFISPWVNNTFSSSKDYLLNTGKYVGSLGNKLFKIHTHPSRSRSNHGFGWASPSDKKNFVINSSYPHYIMSRKENITRYNQQRTYTVRNLDKYFKK